MQNRSCLFFLIGMSICSIVASKEAAIYPIYPAETTIYHESGESIERLMLQLGDESPLCLTNTIAAIKEMNLPDAHILFTWLRLVDSGNTGLNTEVVGPEYNHFLRADNAVFRFVDVSKALDGLFRVMKIGTEHQAAQARRLIRKITRKLRNSTIKPDPGAVPLLAASLHDQDAEVCAFAAEILGCIAPAYTKDAVPALFHALGNENGRVRFETVSTLGSIAAAHPDVQSETAEKLIAILSAPPFIVYRHRGLYHTLHTSVADALTSVGPGAVPPLLDALNTTDPAVRHHAAYALAHLDVEHAVTIVPVLDEALASPSHLTRIYTVFALETLALAQPTLTTEIASILQDANRPEYTKPRTAADLPAPADILRREWDSTYNWDSAANPNIQHKFHQRVSAALKRISPKK